jgi:hypothetical protein
VFKDFVTDGAEFDIKRTSFRRREIGGNSADYEGESFTPEDFGNYNYGVAARAYGYPLDRALRGAGMNQVGKLNPDFSNLEGYFDHKHDTRMIIRGYMHFPFRLTHP